MGLRVPFKERGIGEAGENKTARKTEAQIVGSGDIRHHTEVETSVIVAADGEMESICW